MEHNYKHSKAIIQRENEMALGHYVYVSATLSELKAGLVHLEEADKQARAGEPRPSLIFFNGVDEVRLLLKQE